ncbi:uncharacterized protein LOC104581937 [Brachypodium distachyon]|uniref:uncharacterized protein LOC104581937 n=1 Tax=Brachypodium distachyon TaxID=15368 RepID=UPI0005300994|nr:uncharacterized protein LOC104581937 [Brachypodium distachyon]|eukprot:XP_010229427.1 uncharacterized protein LOC104581937 [Brachypodium distachyon]
MVTMKRMATQQLASIFLFLFLLAAGEGAASAPSAIIFKTCARASNFSATTNVGYDYCVGVLTADPAAVAAHSTRALAVVATKLALDNVTSTVLVLDNLVYNIARCMGYYGGMNYTVTTALEDIRAGHAEAAAGKFSRAAAESGRCDSALSKGSAKKNPMRKENHDAASLSYTAYGITMEALHAKLLAAPSATITKACAGLSNFTTHADYDFCVGALATDPAAGAAKDARALAVVAANLTAANVSSTLLVLNDLLDSLSHCQSTYKDMSKTVAAAAYYIGTGRAGAASDLLKEAARQPDNCDILLFQGSAKKNPMMKENVDAIELSYLAYAIAMLAGSKNQV